MVGRRVHIGGSVGFGVTPHGVHPKRPSGVVHGKKKSSTWILERTKLVHIQHDASTCVSPLKNSGSPDFLFSIPTVDHHTFFTDPGGYPPRGSRAPKCMHNLVSRAMTWRQRSQVNMIMVPALRFVCMFFVCGNKRQRVKTSHPIFRCEPNGHNFLLRPTR